MVKLLPMLNAVVIGLVTGVRSLRATERRTEQMARKKEGWHGLTRRIADNTIGTLLPRLCWPEIRDGLQRMVKPCAHPRQIEPGKGAIPTSPRAGGPLRIKPEARPRAVSDQAWVRSDGELTVRGKTLKSVLQ